MHQLNLPDQVYEKASKQATDAGFKTVEEYVADLVSTDSADYDPDNFDHRFTPKVLQALDEAAADIAAGNFYTSEQVDAHLDELREEWLKKHPH